MKSMKDWIKKNWFGLAFAILMVALVGSTSVVVLIQRAKESHAQRAEELKVLHAQCQAHLEFLEAGERFLQLVNNIQLGPGAEQKGSKQAKGFPAAINKLMDEQIHQLLQQAKEKIELEGEEFDLRKPTKQDLLLLHKFLASLHTRVMEGSKEIILKYKDLEQTASATELSGPEHEELRDMVFKHIPRRLASIYELCTDITDKIHKLMEKLPDKP